MYQKIAIITNRQNYFEVQTVLFHLGFGWGRQKSKTYEYYKKKTQIIFVCFSDKVITYGNFAWLRKNKIPRFRYENREQLISGLTFCTLQNG